MPVENRAGSRAAANGRTTADQIAGYVLLPVSVARRVLPDRELPVYLGVGALAAVGVLEWPVAAAAGLGYAALKRWGPHSWRAAGSGAGQGRAR
jgi:hypothetical protein